MERNQVTVGRRRSQRHDTATTTTGMAYTLRPSPPSPAHKPTRPYTQVFYCPAHTRQWLVSAHRVLETRQILAHLAHNARPIFGVNTDDKPVAHAPNKAPKSKGVRKRKRRVPTCKK